MKGTPVRAVTFQSISRTSSPGEYSRTSSKSMPRPLKTEWYSPASASVTSRRVRSSIWRTFFRISRVREASIREETDGNEGGGDVEGHLQDVEEAFSHVPDRLETRVLAWQMLQASVHGTGSVSRIFCTMWREVRFSASAS